MKERFEILEDFSISEFTNVPFGLFHEKPFSVKVVFDKDLSDYVQRRTWHPSQKIKELKNGRVILPLTASGEEEIKAWILSFGPKAEVLYPKSYREEIREDLLKASARYT
jgi:predicted DNA-binding transcriptional regulator YafY